MKIELEEIEMTDGSFASAVVVVAIGQDTDYGNTGSHTATSPTEIKVFFVEEITEGVITHWSDETGEETGTTDFADISEEDKEIILDLAKKAFDNQQ